MASRNAAAAALAWPVLLSRVSADAILSIGHVLALSSLNTLQAPQNCKLKAPEGDHARAEACLRRMAGRRPGARAT